jgi:hypothetical protein
MNKMPGKSLSPGPAKGHGRQEVWTTKGAVRAVHSSTARQSSARAEAACASVSLRWLKRTKPTPSVPPKYKRPDNHGEASKRGFRIVRPRHQSVRDHCQCLMLNWCSPSRGVLGDKPVFPAWTPSHPCWRPSRRKPCWNWNCLPCWIFFLHHPRAERHREEDRWDGRQDVVTLSSLYQHRHPELPLRHRNQWPCSEPPSFGLWDWMNRWPVWARFFGVLPALFLRRIDPRIPKHSRGC